MTSSGIEEPLWINTRKNPFSETVSKNLMKVDKQSDNSSINTVKPKKKDIWNGEI